MATILLEYDVTFPEGIVERPQNTIFNGVIVPDDRAKVKFIKRSNAKKYNSDQ